MSSPLAIGAVSAVLRNLLDNGVVDAGVPVPQIKVTAVAPDTIKLDDPNGEPSLNLFLYRVSPNTGWSNAQLPSRDAGGARISNPPLALNLHYLLTAYGVADFQAEILLGYGMHVLHERPVLDRAAIRRALDPAGLGPATPQALQALVASDLADQVEAVTLTLEPVDGEEMSRLWSALQASYRPSAGYVVSVVLIEARKPAQIALPVLQRGVAVGPGLVAPVPALERAAPPGDEVAARLGESVTLTGQHLDGAELVASFAHRLLAAPIDIALPDNDDARQVAVTLPPGLAAEQAWPAGAYDVTLTLVPTGEAERRTTNPVSLLLAPVPALSSATFARDATTGHLTVTLPVAPELRPEQDARLVVGAISAVANPRTAAASSLTFEFGNVPGDTYKARLIVDGAESRLVRRSTDPPSFDPSQSLVVPA